MANEIPLFTGSIGARYEDMQRLAGFAWERGVPAVDIKCNNTTLRFDAEAREVSLIGYDGQYPEEATSALEISRKSFANFWQVQQLPASERRGAFSNLQREAFAERQRRQS